jgi:hypothetical protein
MNSHISLTLLDYLGKHKWGVTRHLPGKRSHCFPPEAMLIDAPLLFF